MNESYLKSSLVSEKGLSLGAGEVMPYLYGLSDFWETTFSDIEVINSLLMASSSEASEIYNHFLQLTSGISLSEIQSQLGFQSKLVFIKSSDLVPGSLSSYYLSENITNCKYIVDQPILPTSYLEQGLGFTIDPNKKIISFDKHIDYYSFLFKRDTSQSTDKTYGLWFLDVKVENDVLCNEYARLLDISRPSFVGEAFKRFLYGTYYLYTQGPDLETIRKGLNLVLGIPIAKIDEKVIDIRNYGDSEDYLVITDNNSYHLPYGLLPKVEVGEELLAGQALTTWVEVKDYLSDGDWWLNLYIPETLLPHVEEEGHRYAIPGSYAYNLMSEYLKNHTFLVNIKTTNFRNLQSYADIADIINSVKPAYTLPIYIWTVPLKETLEVNDSFSFNFEANFSEKISNPINRFRRNSSRPLLRGSTYFTRFSAPGFVDDLVGRSPNMNGTTVTTEVGEVSGFINQLSYMAPNKDLERNWVSLMMSRDNMYFRPKRSMVLRTTEFEASEDILIGFDPFYNLYPGKRVLKLFLTTDRNLLQQYSTLGLTELPDENNFTLSGVLDVDLHMKPLIHRYLSAHFPKDSYEVFTPAPEEVKAGDFLLFNKVQDGVIGVYWVTSNQTIYPPPYIPNFTEDSLSTKITGVRTRGQGILGQPSYMMRVRPISASREERNSTNINGMAINDDEELEVDLTLDYYSFIYEDLENPLCGISRLNNTTLTYTRTWK